MGAPGTVKGCEGVGAVGGWADDVDSFVAAVVGFQGKGGTFATIIDAGVEGGDNAGISRDGATDPVFIFVFMESDNFVSGVVGETFGVVGWVGVGEDGGLGGIVIVGDGDAKTAVDFVGVFGDGFVTSEGFAVVVKVSDVNVAGGGNLT